MTSKFFPSTVSIMHPGIPLVESGSGSSTTYGTLTDGNITIGDRHMTSAVGVGAHTDLATANATIAPLPDLKNVMNNQQVMASSGGTCCLTCEDVYSTARSNDMRRSNDSAIVEC